MSKSVITDALLTGIADAIRAKTGGSGQMTPAEMAQEIADIPQGANEPYTEYTCDSGGAVIGAKMVGFTEIPSYMFEHKYLRSLDITESPGITMIRPYAFSYAGSNLDFAIPETVTKIDARAFENAQVNVRTLPAGLTLLGINAFAGSYANISSIPEGITAISGYTFKECRKMTSMTLHSGITAIGDYAFQGCSALASLSLSEGLLSIGTTAFGLCSALTEVTIPSTVTSIGASAFYYCQGLKKVIIKGSTTLLQNAFNYCRALEEVHIVGQPSSINTTAFAADPALTDIYVSWAEGAVAGAPWGATNATIHYNCTFDSNGNVISG